MYVDIIFTWELDVWAEIGYRRRWEGLWLDNDYFWGWRDGSPDATYYFWGDPSGGSYNDYKLFDDYIDGVNGIYLFYVDATKATEHTFDYAPKKIEAKGETNVCQTGFGEAHF